MKTSKWILAALCGLCALTAHPGCAAPLETLTLPDLVNRPDRWPSSVTIERDLNFSSGKSLHPGQSARILEVTEAEVRVDVGDSVAYRVPPEDCDLVAAANQAWAALTPAQRAVDPDALAQDASLWPSRVQIVTSLHFDNGKVVPAGTEYDLVAIAADKVKIFDKADRSLDLVDEGNTDVIARARALALVALDKRPSRIADALKNVLVRADGTPYTSRSLEDTQIFVLYYGASWCPPCRQFTPGFVKYIKRVLPSNPRLSVAMMSNDKDEAQMRSYMTEEHMPWPAAPFAAMQNSPLLLSYEKNGIPQVVILDRQGKVLAENYDGDQYLAPMAAVQSLAKILASGAAR